jgi:hypothetical protein
MGSLSAYEAGASPLLQQRELSAEKRICRKLRTQLFQQLARQLRLVFAPRYQGEQDFSEGAQVLTIHRRHLELHYSPQAVTVDASEPEKEALMRG